MSDGDRGPQGKAATQDPYAKAADAAARSRTARSGSGARNGSNGSSGSAGSSVSNGSTGSNGRSTGASSANGGARPAAAPSVSARTSQPAAAKVAEPKVAEPKAAESKVAESKAAESKAEPKNAGEPAKPAVPAAHAQPTTTEKPGGSSWKDKLGALTKRVTGGDRPEPASKPAAAATPAAATAPSTGKTTAAPAARARTSKDADEPTAVVAAPPAPAQARVTGTRTAAPVAAGAVVVAKPEARETEKHKAGTPRRTRKARLRLSRLDPWSVMKTAFMFSIAGGIMLVVGVYAIWTVISGSGLFDNVNEIIASVVSTPGDTTPFRVEDYINTPKVMGVTAFLACIDVVIFTALATLGSFLYNLAATMLGGLEITLAED